jgi:hypothetical protein
MAHKYFHFKPMSLEQQILSMGKHFPNFSVMRQKGSVTWTGHLQPTPTSETCKIIIAYDLKEWPKVRVLSPELVTRTDAEKIPHTYPGNRLCLYLPKACEWTKDMLISKTIVWTSPEIVDTPKG